MAEPSEQAIHILDEITVRPGRSQAYIDAYLADYAPLARGRGMTLRLSSRTPAVDVAGVPVTLIFLWSVPSVAAWWGMRVRDTAAKIAWWDRAAAMTVGRTRRMLVQTSLADPPA